MLLVALTLAAYAPALQAGFIWDDDSYVTANPTLQTLDGLRRIWLEPGAVPQYYPLTFTSFWIEHHLWGLQPLGYHLTNVLLHTLNALLLWLVLVRLRVPGAWVAAALFALHPMQVESVAWVCERKNVLSGMFALSAILVWPRFLPAAVLFGCALLSKSVTCSLPAVLLLIVWWQQGAIDRRTAWRVVPLFVVGLGMASVTIWMEEHHVGAAGEEWALSLVERALVAGRALWFYPRKFLWPGALTFMYPRWSVDARVWWQYLFPAAAVAVIVVLHVARRKIGRGPLVATLYYAGSLTPALGFFNVFPMRYSFVADHFAYLPMIGLAALASAGGSDVVQRLSLEGRRLGYGACAVVLLVLSLLTARQCGIYRDLHSLWTDTLAKNPDCWMAHNNLGAMLVKEGAVDDGIAHLTQALLLKPNNPEAENDLAVAFDMQGQHDDAITHYMQALRLNPDYPNAHYNLADTLRTLGKTDDAIVHYLRALRLKPRYPEAHNSLGLALAGQRKFEEAIAHYTEALRLNPEYPEAYYNLGNAFRAQGKVEDAITPYAAALRLRPGYAEVHNNLGAALAAQGRTADARAHLEQALRLKPNYAEAHFNLGAMLIGERRLGEATAHFMAGLETRPEYAEAHKTLGSLLVEQGRGAEAIAQFEAALQLKPDDAEARQQLDRLR